MLAVWLRWVAGMEIFLGSCEICLSLPNSFSLLFDLAVPSTQGCLCLPAWPGRKTMVPQRAGVGHSCSPCRRTQGMASLTSVLCVAAGTAWSCSAGLCHLFRMGREFGLPKLVRGTARTRPQTLLCLAVMVQPPLPLWALEQSKPTPPHLFPGCVAQHCGLHQSEA